MNGCDITKKLFDLGDVSDDELKSLIENDCFNEPLADAADIRRRSRATGCCCKSRRRHIASMSRSFWVIWLRSSGSSPASAVSQDSRAWDALAMAFSQSMPMVVISRFRSSSCISNFERIIQTSP